MKKQEIIDLLSDFGLSENEAEVYLAALSLGPTSIQNISKDTGIKRTTVYPIIENLKKKGLINSQVLKLKKPYGAESPNTLESLFDIKREKLRKALPELTAIQNLKGGESFIKYYEGVEGVKAVYNGILDDLKPGDKYLIMSDMEKFLAMDNDFFSHFIEKRAKLDLETRSILQKSPSAQYYKKIERNVNQKIKFLPSDVDLTANLVILPNKVIVTQMVPPIMTVIIENKSIMQIHHEQFEIIWKSII